MSIANELRDQVRAGLAGLGDRPAVPGVCQRLGVRVVCLRTLAHIDSRSIQDTMDFLAGQPNITKDQAIAHIA